MLYLQSKLRNITEKIVKIVHNDLSQGLRVFVLWISNDQRSVQKLTFAALHRLCYLELFIVDDRIFDSVTVRYQILLCMEYLGEKKEENYCANAS